MPRRTYRRPTPVAASTWEVNARWLTFAPDGKLVGRFQLPDRMQVMEIGADYLLGLYRDDMEVEYLRLYDLTRPG